MRIYLSFFSFLLLICISIAPNAAINENIKNTTASKTQEAKGQKLVVQEAFYRTNVDLKEVRIERVFTIFDFKNGTWVSLQKEHAATQKRDEAHQALVQEKLSSLTEFLEWIKEKPVDLAKLHFLKKARYPGWEGKKEVKIFSAVKIETQSAKWKPTPLPSNLLKMLAMDFRNRYPKIAYPWHEKDLKIKSAYLSSKGAWLVGVAMDMKKTKLIKNYDGVVEEEFSTHWFAVIYGVQKFLGEDLYPLLAADFLNDGKTEWLMGYAGYNREGYILWDEDFNNKCTFIYSFH